MMKRAAAAWVAAVVGCGGGEQAPPPGVLEIGAHVAGAFQAFGEGDVASVVLGANGLNMIQPSLRAADIDPRAPDPTVTVTVAGILMAADIEGARVDLKSDGTGYVLWDLRVPFQTELCCFVCRPGKVTAQIRDAAGRQFKGEVTVSLQRGGCPDPPACCVKADACPDPALTQVCS